MAQLVIFGLSCSPVRHALPVCMTWFLVLHHWQDSLTLRMKAETPECNFRWRLLHRVELGSVICLGLLSLSLSLYLPSLSLSLSFCPCSLPPPLLCYDCHLYMLQCACLCFMFGLIDLFLHNQNVRPLQTRIVLRIWVVLPYPGCVWSISFTSGILEAREMLRLSGLLLNFGVRGQGCGLRLTCKYGP